MRILFLTMYYQPDSAATGILMAELAEELALHGHDVRVITSMPHYSTNSIWPEYKGKWSKRERQGQILVHRVWSYVPVHKDRLLPRFFSYLSFTLLSALAGLLMPRPDVIVTPSQGLQLQATNLTGHPAVILPNGVRGDGAPLPDNTGDGELQNVGGPGTPVSLTFLGALYSDARLAAFARAYQVETSFHLQHPKLG